jgi:molybdate transport system ATP-binding protein
MISVHVEKNYGTFATQAKFKAPDKGVTALFGSSGAGKSSIINMVAGLVRPDRGHIRINGHCLFDFQSGIDLPPERRRIGYVFQNGRLFPHLSVRSNLTYGMRRIGADQRYITLEQAVTLLGIEHLLDRRPARLSGGEKQRVAIGRALLTSPSLLLMDEPLASLDDPRKAEVLPFIARLTREFSIPILYVSHAWDEIVTLADALILVDKGQIAAAGHIDELMVRRDLHRFMNWRGSSVLLNTVVKRHEADLTCLDFAGGGTLKVPRGNWPQGARLRIHIESRHVAIALTRPEHTSFQNVLPAVVKAITRNGDFYAEVHLDIGTLLLAQVTVKTLRDLNLKPGQRVFAMVKMSGCRRKPWCDVRCGEELKDSSLQAEKYAIEAATLSRPAINS